MLLIRVFFHNMKGTVHQQASHLHVFQFLFAVRQRPIQKRRIRMQASVVHPITALNHLHRLFRCGEFFIVFFDVIFHFSSSFSESPYKYVTILSYREKCYNNTYFGTSYMQKKKVI